MLYEPEQVIAALPGVLGMLGNRHPRCSRQLRREHGKPHDLRGVPVGVDGELGGVEVVVLLYVGPQLVRMPFQTTCEGR